VGEILEAILLGIVQGLTEFLPVSSSGHLEIAKVLLQDDSLDNQSLFTTVLLHFATALSTLVVFRKDIWDIINRSIKKEGKDARKFIIYIIISMIPAVLVGLTMEETIESLFSKNLLLVAGMLFITGVLLFIADRSYDNQKPVRGASSFVIGISQAIAILPGISRSGATISAALLLGISRHEAAQFSFLMVVPVIFGKIAKDLIDGSFFTDMPSIGYSIAGFFAAFITGYFACTWMIKLVKQAGLKYFAYYCFIVVFIIFGFHFL